MDSATNHLLCLQDDTECLMKTHKRFQYRKSGFSSDDIKKVPFLRKQEQEGRHKPRSQAQLAREKRLMTNEMAH